MFQTKKVCMLYNTLIPTETFSQGKFTIYHIYHEILAPGLLAHSHFLLLAQGRISNSGFTPD